MQEQDGIFLTSIAELGFSITSVIFNKSIDELNLILNGLFSDHKNKRELAIQCVFLFFVFYLNGKDSRLKIEAVKMHKYIAFPDLYNYTVNTDIYDSVYLILISLMESDRKTRKNGGFLKKFDQILVRNIEAAQSHPDISFDPKKTPITSELLLILSSLFDTIDIKYYIDEVLDRKMEAIEKIK